MRCAIVGLVRGWSDKLMRRCQMLHDNYNKDRNRDQIIFCEGNFTTRQRQVMRNHWPTIKFRRVAFSSPEGYKNMCRFYSMEMAPILCEMGYDYYWRMDDDSFLHSTQHCPFQYVHNNGLVYGYLHSKLDAHKETARTLPPFVKKWCEDKNIKPRWGEINHQNFYNNFHVSRVSFWMREDVRMFLHAIDQDGGIYRHRWGDHVIQALALKIFAEENQVAKIPGVHYEHGSHNKWIKT